MKVNLTNRGAIRSFTDGRYRFSRYFSPLQHNLPETMDDLINASVERVLDLLGAPAPDAQRWQGF